jgi:hypothetical protein
MTDEDVASMRANAEDYVKRLAMYKEELERVG